MNNTHRENIPVSFKFFTYENKKNIVCSFTAFF